MHTRRATTGSAGARDPYSRLRQVLSKVKNGQLIAEAVRRQYDMLITADRKMQKRERISTLPLRIVVLSRPHWDSVREKIGAIQDAIDKAQPGQFTRVEAGPTPPQRGITFREEEQGRFTVEEQLGRRGRSRTLLSNTTLADAMKWLTATGRTTEEEAPKWERNILNDVERQRRRERGR